MAGYDPEKDKVLKKWECGETGLMVSINRYGAGEAKLQIGPRVIIKQDGTKGRTVKAGRLTIEDVMWLYEVIDEVKDELAALVDPMKQ
jgi:hypothetical protein